MVITANKDVGCSYALMVIYSLKNGRVLHFPTCEGVDRGKDGSKNNGDSDGKLMYKVIQAKFSVGQNVCLVVTANNVGK